MSHDCHKFYYSPFHGPSFDFSAAYYFFEDMEVWCRLWSNLVGLILGGPAGLEPLQENSCHSKRLERVSGRAGSSQVFPRLATPFPLQSVTEVTEMYRS
jgi:hypothetical protein